MRRVRLAGLAVGAALGAVVWDGLIDISWLLAVFVLAGVVFVFVGVIMAAWLVRIVEE